MLALVLILNKMEAQNTNSYISKVDSLYSENLKEYRKYYIYMPQKLKPSSKYNIIFATDGQEIQNYHRLLDSLMQSKNKPIAPTIIIGIFSNEKANGLNSTLRFVEYVKNNSERYINHKKFFLEEVECKIFEKYGLENNINKRLFYGFSNGAAFGLDIFFTANTHYDHYICFSPLGVNLEAIKFEKKCRFKTSFYCLRGEGNFYCFRKLY